MFRTARERNNISPRSSSHTRARSTVTLHTQRETDTQTNVHTDRHTDRDTAIQADTERTQRENEKATSLGKL